MCGVDVHDCHISAFITLLHFVCSKQLSQIISNIQSVTTVATFQQSTLQGHRATALARDPCMSAQNKGRVSCAGYPLLSCQQGSCLLPQGAHKSDSTTTEFAIVQLGSKAG